MPKYLNKWVKNDSLLCGLVTKEALFQAQGSKEKLKVGYIVTVDYCVYLTVEKVGNFGVFYVTVDMPFLE